MNGGVKSGLSPVLIRCSVFPLTSTFVIPSLFHPLVPTRFAPFFPAVTSLSSVLLGGHCSSYTVAISIFLLPSLRSGRHRLPALDLAKGASLLQISSTVTI
jgi:hypothetical protein